MPIWAPLRDCIAQEGRAILVSVLATRGSTPREAGARMIVSPQGLRGTIGGGTLEYQAWQEASALLQAREPKAALNTRILGPDLGQCCGGQVTLGLEYFSHADQDELDHLAQAERIGFSCRTEFGAGAHATRHRMPMEPSGPAMSRLGPVEFQERFHDQRTHLHLFGAGHVGQALILALAPLPFRVSWYDERPDAFPKIYPAQTELCALPSPEKLQFSSDDYIIIMTHSHPLDLALLIAGLRSSAGFVGVIGSATKRARFLSRLKALQFSAQELSRFICPLGINQIEGKEPAVIAASIAAQLLIERSRAQKAFLDIVPTHAIHQAMKVQA
jgi:xanthine dehydrogenase accessory factor